MSVFRELLQNSDDAGAHAAEIRFETEAFLDEQKNDGYSVSARERDKGLPDLKSVVVSNYNCFVVRNQS